MSESLAVKYRPKTFNDVIGQPTIVKILERQIETKQFKNCYLFSGGSGCGKTTLARILANAINEGQGSPIEIDAASNSGVDSVRQITESAVLRSIDSEYKIYIIDECHSLTTQSWQALLKTIEETPKYTIFMFCTTEYHKVPETIKNRCQQFNIQRINVDNITGRLMYICSVEHFNFTKDALIQIAKLSQGSMRQAIANLEKCASYSSNITLENVLSVLGDFSYDIYFKLINGIIDKNQQVIIDTIEGIFTSGSDLRVFLDMFISFVLNLSKYTIFHSYSVINIPVSYDEQLKYTVNLEGATKYLNHIVDKLLQAKVVLKTDNDAKTTLEIMLLNL